jgi:hypothetical protein
MPRSVAHTMSTQSASNNELGQESREELYMRTEGEKLTLQSVEFCQLKGGPCSAASRPAELSPESCFAAYPFEASEMDSMERLKELLHSA